MASEEPRDAVQGGLWRVLGLLAIALTVILLLVFAFYAAWTAFGPDLIKGWEEAEQWKQDDWRITPEMLRNLAWGISTLMVVLAGLVGLVFSAARTSALDLQARKQIAEQRLAEKSRRTDDFLKAVEMLGSTDDERRPVRLGALFALERLASEPACETALRQAIGDTLTGFLNDRAEALRARTGQTDGAGADNGDDPPDSIDAPEDLANALVILATLMREHDVSRGRTLSLSHFRFPPYMRLDGADLREADFNYTIFSKTSFVGANLEFTDFYNAILEWSYFYKCEFFGTNFECARLDWSSIKNENMKNSILRGTQLFSTHLKGTRFSNNDLKNTTLLGSDLDNTDFQKVLNLTPNQINKAHWNSVNRPKLPPYLEYDSNSKVRWAPGHGPAGQAGG